MIIVIEGQSLVDIAIQECGGIEGLVDLALRNGKSVTDLLQVGESLAVGEAVNKDVVNYLKSRAIKIATGAEMFYPALINILQNTLSFSNVEIGSTAMRSFTIQNIGNSILNIASITLPFASYTVNWSGGAIAVGGSQVVNVTYAPTTIGAQNGNITLNSNATNTTNEANVVGVTATGFRVLGIFCDGINDFVQTDLNIDVNTSYSFSCYFSLTSVGTSSVIFGNGDAGNWNMAAGYSSGNTLSFAITKPGVSYSATTPILGLVANTLYHAVFIYNNTTLQIYLNGNLITTVTIPSGALRNENVNMTIGKRYDTAVQMNGIIFEFMAVNRVLTVSEITDLYNFTVPASILSNIVSRLELESIYKTGINIFTPATVGSPAQVFGKATGSKCIVDRFNADVQLTP